MTPVNVDAADAPFEWPVRVYWEDTDAGGIVFYANYLKFMERARTEWLRSLGVEQRGLRERGEAGRGGQFVVSETQLKYHRPARLDDELIVTAQLRELGRASLTIAQRVLLRAPAGGADQQYRPHQPQDHHHHRQPQPQHQPQPQRQPQAVLLCEGTIRIGWVDAATLLPARMPSEITGTLGRLQRSTNTP